VSDARVLYLVRHGRSDFSSNDMIPTPRGYQFDPPLSEVGRQQAAQLAKRLLLLHPQPTAVYCSPLRRCRETVAPYAEASGAEIRFDEDLVEAHIGEWENKPFEEILEDERMLTRLRNQEPIWSHAPGAEDPVSFRERIRGAIDRILDEHPVGNVLVVCHGGVINAYLGPILGIEHEMFFLPENTSVNSVEVDGERRSVRFLNDVVHLTDPHLLGLE
jgi:broad specificity phosphatase PhoE